MKQIRQDAWSKAEDELLAQIVLHYIGTGNTQIEAFKEAAKQLHRTPAACGFRWNAAIREKYKVEINEARKDKKAKQKKLAHEANSKQSENPIQSAIALLEKINTHTFDDQQILYEQEIASLQIENQALKKQILFYEEAWQEIGKIWKWAKENQAR